MLGERSIQGALVTGAVVTRVPMGLVSACLLGAYLLALGQVLPRVRRNPLIGIRTTWSITSDENWARTHRFASYALSLGGLAALTLGFVSPALGLLVAMGSVLLPAVFSYVMALRQSSES